jgi:hypothetical protein
MAPIAKDWFKSSASCGTNNCVQARFHTDGSVDIRNSKDPEGPMVSFDKDEWAAFLAGVGNGEFNAA